MTEEKIPFLDMFPDAAVYADSCGGLDKAEVSGVTIVRETMTMIIRAWLPQIPAPAELRQLEELIASRYGLAGAELRADYPEPERKEVKAREKTLMGRPIRPNASITPMKELTLESGGVTVEGEIFADDSRTLAKRGAAVLSFKMTDYSGSVLVSKYLPGDADQSILGEIKPGLWVKVQGRIDFDRFANSMVLQPTAIVKGSRPERVDTADEKRVELHLHTRFSALDALSDPGDLIAQAAKWGHPAIAVTDHGVAQAFPDAWKAAKKHGIKIIYGIEGYLINDVDGTLAAHGGEDLPLDQEYIAFDIETTGLRVFENAMTEIGAVRFRGKEILDTFNTFVDPGMPIPEENTRLTGIRDIDVQGAPKPAEAMRMFLDFCGDTPLIAHNADFDTGFMSDACHQAGIPFEPVYLDTLPMAQFLLPDLKRHKLDMVSNRLSLPEFNHHRASDDAMVVARIMERFIPMFAEKGAHTLGEMNALVNEGLEHRRRPRHISILVRSKKGLKNLYEIISQSYLKYFKRNPTIPKSVLMQYREGLIVGSACEAGELFDAMLYGKSRPELRRIGSFYDYFEIMPLANNRFLIENGTVKDDESLRELNRRILALGREMGRPVVATGDVHFLHPEQEIYRHVMLGAKGFSDADKEMPLYFRTTDDMLEEFSYLGEETAREVVVKNTVAIADTVETFELLPKDLFPPKIENSAEELKSLVYGKMHAIYGENPPEIITSRVETELHDILSRGYDVIYMSAQKLVANSLEHGYLVGSRGSVGSSLVAYFSGITEVNSLPAHYVCPNCRHTDFESGKGYGCGADMPDKVCPECGTEMKKEGFDIPFETFLGFGGDKVPDIDLNFSGEYQGRAHKYTEELFGSDHVFRAGTIGTLAEKTAYGYVLKYAEERGLDIPQAEKDRLAHGCVGVKRTTGQHPGGLVVIPQDMDVTDFCPVQHPADDPNSDIITTHFEYHCMEANLLKLDELGHDDPTMIRMLEDMTGRDAKQIRLDDPETMGIFKSPAPLGLPDDDPIIGKTGTIGIPEFGTGFTRQMLVDTQPDTFDVLVRLSGFSHGTDVWLGNAKDLITSGTATVAQTVGCRDDIMLYLISRGIDAKVSFKIMEAVRKGKVARGGFQDGWVDLMKDHDVPQWYIDSLAKIQYLFPKAHAVAYVMMAFRIAWFKVHEPLAFYSAYFYRRSQKDSFDAEIMCGGTMATRSKINELQNKAERTSKEDDLLVTLEAVYEFNLRGFSFEPIDINRSDATRFIPNKEKGTLLPPFVAISGLGESAAQDLKRCREGGREFVSEEEIAIACPKVSQTHMKQLRDLGAFGSLPETSQMSLF